MSSNAIKTAFDRAWQRAQERSWTPGKLGRPDGTIQVARRPKFCYVRVGMEGTQTVAIARNAANVPLLYDLPVRMRRENGVFTIHGVDYSGGRWESAGPTSSNTYGVPRHTHARGTNLEYVVESLRLEPGRLSWSGSGLTVAVGAFRYFTSGGWVSFEGDSTDLTSFMPATASKWAWIIVGIDPATNLIDAVTSTEQVNQVDLTTALLDATDIGDLIPVGAIQVQEGETDLSTEARFFEARGWLGKGVTDHGELTGLADDDHPQYHNDSRGDARYFREDEHISSSSGVADAGKPIVLDAGGLISGTMIDDSDIDHGSIGGLADDDHTQYHNNARGDARYYTETELDAGQLDNRYYRENEHISSSAGVADAGKPIVLDAGGLISGTMIDDSDIDHGSIGGLADDDHTQYHNDTRGDVRYYQKTAHISSSAGVADAGKPIVLDAGGLISGTMIDDSDIDHGSVGGLSDDDHAQYALLAGRSGGQTLTGGTGSGDDLILHSTSHSTKGYILLGPNGSLVGIGKSAPVATLDVQGTFRLGDGTNQAYLLKNWAAPGGEDNLVFQGQQSAAPFGLVMLAKDGDGTDNVKLQIMGVGADGSIANRERLLFGWDAANSWYELQSEAQGTGTLRPLVLFTEGNTAQLYLATDGKIGVMTSSPSSALSVKAGSSSDHANVGGILFVSTTGVGNVGSGEDDLITFSVPANTLANNGESIWFEAAVSFAVNANNKTLRVRFGSSGTTLIVASTSFQWQGVTLVQGRIFRTGATSQEAYAVDGIKTGMSDYVTGLNQTLSGAVSLRITGEGVSNDDIVCQSLIVGWSPANT